MGPNSLMAVYVDPLGVAQCRIAIVLDVLGIGYIRFRPQRRLDTLNPKPFLFKAGKGLLPLSPGLGFRA